MGKIHFFIEWGCVCVPHIFAILNENGKFVVPFYAWIAWHAMNKMVFACKDTLLAPIFIAFISKIVLCKFNCMHFSALHKA